MKSNPFKVFIISFVMISGCQYITGQTINPPPYLAHSPNFIMCLFYLDANDVQSILPKDIEVLVDKSGMVKAGLEIYSTDRISGIPGYATAFIFVEVKGFDSQDGTPGHWAVWGNLNDQTVLQNFHSYYGFPYAYEDQIRVGIQNNIRYGMIGPEGNEKIIFRVECNEEQPFSTEGKVNMCGRTDDGQTVITQVPWYGNGYQGKPVEFNIHPKGDKILEMIAKTKPFWAMVSVNQTFTYTRPIVKQR